MRNKYLILIVILKLVNLKCFCQNFVNGDLEGVVTIGSDLPDLWQNIPFSDINCIASQSGWDSPDLTNLTGPNLSSGINGNPYSGLTFVSGMYGGDSSNFWQEGIMQSISNFIIGESYSIHFYQTVVRNINCLDKSGSWAVYIDTALAGITSPTHSIEPYGSNQLIWETRTISFTATSNFHQIKFLPIDNDFNSIFSTTDTTGALRMGIDSIGLEVLTSINEQTQKEFILTPNPNTGNFRLELKNSIDKPMNLVITDLYGEIIDEKIITNTLTNYENINLKDGIYFYILRQGITEIEKGKIMVIL